MINNFHTFNAVSLNASNLSRSLSIIWLVGTATLFNTQGDTFISLIRKVSNATISNYEFPSIEFSSFSRINRFFLLFFFGFSN